MRWPTEMKLDKRDGWNIRFTNTLLISESEEMNFW